MLKTEVKDRGFYIFPRERANVNGLENHVWSLSLHKNTVRCTKTRNLWRKWTRKAVLPVAESPRKWHVHCVCFKNAAPRANTNVMSTSRFYDCYNARYWFWRHFCDGTGMLTVKAAKQIYNSTWIALFKHEFVLVNTWLLIGAAPVFMQ